MIEQRTQRGSAAELHALDPFAAGPVEQPQLWRMVVDRSALVLGSRQRDDIVNQTAVGRDRVDVAARRSGGGAVLVVPGDVEWIDVVLPLDATTVDVRASMIAVGELFADALEPFVSSELSVHRAGMVCTPWSDLVCFAGIGPGEVIADGRKLVGLSQRRTRHGCRVQAMFHRRSHVARTAGYLVDGPSGAPVEAAEVPDADAHVVVAQLASRLSGQP